MDHRLVKFTKVAEHRSFTAAAKDLHVSQPALSVAIKSLEKEVGALLFDRKGKQLVLTEVGQLVYDYASRIRLELDNMLREVSMELKSARRLKLGLIDSVANLLFSAPDLPEFSQQTEVEVDNTSRLIKAVELDRLDLAFITTPTSTVSSKLNIQALGFEPFVVVASPKSADSVQRSLRQKKFIPDLVTYNRNSYTFRHIEQQLRRQKISYKPSLFSTSPDLMRLMAIHNRGVAVLPLSVVQDDISSARLAKVNGVSINRPIAQVMLKGKFISQDMATLAKFITSRLKSGRESYKTTGFA